MALPASTQGGKPAKRHAAAAKKKGLGVLRIFSKPDIKPFDEVEWERRTAEITDDAGKVIFKQENVEVPKSWSILATKVVVSKYFYGENGTTEREHSVRQLIHRVTRTIADWGKARRLFRQRQGRGDVLRRIDLALPQPIRIVQFPGLVQLRPLPRNTTSANTVAPAISISTWPPGAIKQRHHAVRIPAMLRLLHPVRRRHDGRHHGTGPQRSHALQVRQRHGHGPVHRCAAPAKNSAAAAGPAARCRS